MPNLCARFEKLVNFQHPCYVFCNFTRFFFPFSGQTRALDLLIKAGADAAVKDGQQRTLLHHASLVKNNVKLVEMLIDCGLDIEAMDKDGIRSIDMAIGHGNEAMVASLLRKGAKLGPTTWAMSKGKPRIA